MTKRDDVVLCSLRDLYLLEGLTEEERRDFEEHLATCSECQSELESMAPLKDWLLYDFEPIDPPADMKQRVLNRVFETTAETAEQPELQVATPPMEAQVQTPVASQAPFPATASSANASPARRTHRRLGPAKYNRWLAMVSVAALLVAAVGIYVAASRPAPSNQNPTGPLGQVTTSLKLASSSQFPASSAKLLVMTGQTGKRMMINFSGLKPVTGTEVYQVWLLKKGSPPLSMGVFTPNSSGDAVFAGLLPSEPYTEVGVTLEPKAIDKAPKGPIVLSGTATV